MGKRRDVQRGKEEQQRKKREREKEQQGGTNREERRNSKEKNKDKRKNKKKNKSKNLLTFGCRFALGWGEPPPHSGEPFHRSGRECVGKVIQGRPADGFKAKIFE